MGKLLKILLHLFFAVIALIIVGVIVLPLIIDPNDYKPEIEKFVLQNTGRKLTIAGDLELSVFPWLGIATGPMTLGNAPGFDDKPFARIKSSQLKAKLIPLLSKDLEVSRVVLNGLQLNLIKSVTGKKNWTHFTLAENNPDEKALPSADLKDVQTETAAPLIASTLAIGGISIKDAVLVWDDKELIKPVIINNINLETGKIHYAEPVKIALSFTANNLRPGINARLDLDTQLLIKNNFKQLSLTSLQIKSTLENKQFKEGKILSTLTADCAVDLAAQQVKINKLSFVSDDLKLSGNLVGNQLKSQPVFKGQATITDFNLRNLLSTLGQPLGKRIDNTALSRLTGEFNFQYAKKNIAFKQLHFTVDDSTITGTAAIKPSSPAAIAFDLNIDTLNADRYFPQTGNPKKSAKLTAKTSSPTKQGNLPKQSESEQTGVQANATAPNNKQNRTATANPAIRIKADAFLKTLQANGQLHIGSLIIKHLKMQAIDFTVKAKNGVIKTRNNIQHFYQGAITGDLNLDTRNTQPVLSISQKMSQLQMEPLLRDLKGKAKLSGVFNATTNLKARGGDVRSIKSSLNGDLDFLLKDGIIHGFNLHKIIAKGKTLIGAKKHQFEDTQQTQYSEISGSAKIVNGLIKNDDLVAISMPLKVRGQGTADLISEKLDYHIVSKLMSTDTRAAQPEKVKRTVKIDIAGSFAQPHYLLDIRSLITAREKQKLYDKIDKKLGPKVSDLLKQFLH